MSLPMINELYNTDILSLAANIGHVGRLEHPQGTSRKVSKLCGSWVEVDVCLKDGAVSEFAQRLQACALGQASAAILAKHILGASAEEIKAARDALAAMLKEGGAPPKGRFSGLSLLEGVKDYPARHTSTLLAFEAAVEAFDGALEKL